MILLNFPFIKYIKNFKTNQQAIFLILKADFAVYLNYYYPFYTASIAGLVLLNFYFLIDFSATSSSYFYNIRRSLSVGRSDKLNFYINYTRFYSGVRNFSSYKTNIYYA